MIAFIGLVAMLLFASERTESFRCSIGTLRNNPEGYHYRLDDIRRFVADASVIVRVTALDSSRATKPKNARVPGWGTITFRVDEVLRGPDRLERLNLPGVFVESDDFNAGAVPYRIVRSAGQGGDCFAHEYRKGAAYLLMLKPDSTGFSQYWAPLGPVNEQLRGSNDPWLSWVRTEMRR